MNSHLTITKVFAAIIATMMLFSTAAYSFATADVEEQVERSRDTREIAGSDRALEIRLGEMSPEELKDYLLAKEGMHLANSYNPFNRSTAVPIIAVVTVFGMPVLIIALIGFFKYKRRKLLHETVRAMVEKGADIPPHLFEDENVQPRSAFRKGLVLTGVGLGLSAFFLFAGETEGIGIGMIPMFIGAAYLLIWKLEERGGKDLDQR